MPELRVPLPESTEQELKLLMFDAAKTAFIQVAKRESMPRYMNKRQAAEYLQCAVNTLNKYIAQGLRVITVDNMQRIDKADADKFMEQHKM